MQAGLTNVVRINGFRAIDVIHKNMLRGGDKGFTYPENAPILLKYMVLLSDEKAIPFGC